MIDALKGTSPSLIRVSGLEVSVIGFVQASKLQRFTGNRLDFLTGNQFAFVIESAEHNATAVVCTEACVENLRGHISGIFGILCGFFDGFIFPASRIHLDSVFRIRRFRVAFLIFLKMTEYGFQIVALGCL